MAQPGLIKLVCLLVVLAGPGKAIADVTLSQSNDPNAGLVSKLTQLFGGEKIALNEIESTRIDRLQFRPKIFTAASRTAGFSYSQEFLDNVPTAKGDAEWRCLTEALYFEARGESVKGQFAVAEVILNRVDSVRFPNTACKVVNQGTGRKFQCQFTYTCDGYSEIIREHAAWDQVGKVARILMDGTERRLTEGATHYHTHAVRPRWSRMFARTVTIGAHHFYRMPTRTASKG